METAIITAIYGEFDSTPPVPKGFSEAILVSDTPITSEWKNIVHPLPIPNRLAAKIPKFRPDLFTNCPSSVWMDASCRDETNWLSRTAKLVLDAHELSAFRHPTRNCIYEEAACCAEWPKHQGWQMKKQIQTYKSRGYPPNNGLWAGGILMRRHTEAMKDLGNKWLLENTYYSIQDQVSLPYLLWELNISCNPLPDRIWHGPLMFVSHQKKEDLSFRKRLLRKIKQHTDLFSRP